VVCPSNPYLSIDPIIAVPGIRAAIEAAPVPVVCVSPIIGGAAVKGPTAKIMSELGTLVTNSAIAAHYHGLIDGLVIDLADAAAARDSVLPHCVTATLMRTLANRDRLAREQVVAGRRRMKAVSGRSAASLKRPTVRRPSAIPSSFGFMQAVDAAEAISVIDA
jgi:LPPG:FO 2-phospho-L-lactate transferase